MEAGCSGIFGTLGLRPWRAAPAQRAPRAFGLLCLLLCHGAGIPAVLTFASRMEPLAEGFSGRPVLYKFGALDV
ncbi:MULTISPECIES: hypothetical protein [unclassified Thioalkalivibrio]|uniref:hypothetical protein n=1 Tax=unclassified Thioalkalivibrio TaxID=2621013 RepID=UPI0009DAB347|nr:MULTISPECIES: hypothetical protein [unclassified Thioalkalivibrio]